MEGNNNYRGEHGQRRISTREGYRPETRGPYRTYGRGRPRYEYPRRDDARYEPRRDDARYGQRRSDIRNGYNTPGRVTQYGRRQMERRPEFGREQMRGAPLTKEYLDAQLIKYMQGSN
ncbi:hypothetical protein TCON_2324 [Astathelohania contejeani]|uniref:Uncharacterized protein n=1 Tax=Astathelohania contejeani TaxID=164912 RepID=A0ABQ7HWB9_9MICR|nr:hypothetical protein TCON_2324 [Thelohania contejeani]